VVQYSGVCHSGLFGNVGESAFVVAAGAKDRESGAEYGLASFGRFRLRAQCALCRRSSG
jgi:hypothetical protein